MRTQLRRLLSRVGDFHSRSEDSSPLHVNIKGLAAALQEDLEPHGEKVVALLVQCSEGLPLQSGVYAALVALLNLRHPGFVRRLLQTLAARLTQVLSSAHEGAVQVVRAKLVVRFLGELLSCRVLALEGEGGFASVLEGLVIAMNDHEAHYQGTRDMAAQILVSALVWCMPTLVDRWGPRLEKCMAFLKDHMESRHQVFSKQGLRSPFVRVEEEEDADEGQGQGGPPKRESEEEPCTDSLAAMWGVAKDLYARLEASAAAAQPPNGKGVAEASHPISTVVQPWRQLAEELEQEGQVHTLQGWKMPELGPLRSPTCLCFTLFDADSGQGAAAMVALPPSERVVLAEYVRDVFVTFRPVIRKTDGERTGNPSTVAEQMLSIAKLVPPGSCTEYLVVEVVMAALLSLPSELGPYLHRLILELLRTEPTKLPPAVACATELLFRRVPDMDPCASRALALWFGHNLSNTGFAWPYWAHWAFVADRPEDDPQRVFVAAVFECCVRLTYLDRIRQVVPPQLQALLPPEPAAYSRFLDGDGNLEGEEFVAPKVRGKGEEEEDEDEDDEDEDEPTKGRPAMCAITKALLGKIEDKAEESELEAALFAGQPAEEGEGGAPAPPISEATQHAMDRARAESGDQWRAVALMHALLRAGQATISHVRSLLDRHRHLLRRLTNAQGHMGREAAQGHQMALVVAVGEVWQTSNQMFEYIMDELLIRSFVSPQVVVAWVFSDECVVGLAQAPFLWDLLRRAITLSIERVHLAAEVVVSHGLSPAELNQPDCPPGPVQDLDLLRRYLKEAQELGVYTMQRFVLVRGQYIDESGGPEVAAQFVGTDPWFHAITGYFHAICRIYTEAGEPIEDFEDAQLGAIFEPRLMIARLSQMKVDPYSYKILSQLPIARVAWAYSKGLDMAHVEQK